MKQLNGMPTAFSTCVLKRFMTDKELASFYKEYNAHCKSRGGSRNPLMDGATMNAYSKSIKDKSGLRGFRAMLKLKDIGSAYRLYALCASQFARGNSD